jgi:hypothetical protein
MMLSSAAIRIVLTCPVPVISAPNVVSSTPVDVRRANLLLLVPSTVVNCQPIITLPSVCRATAFTVQFTFQVNDVSNVPVVVTRAILFIVFLSTDVNAPQIIILLSGWSAIPYTLLFAVHVNVLSSHHVAVVRAILVHDAARTCVKFHPMIIF